MRVRQNGKFHASYLGRMSMDVVQIEPVRFLPVGPAAGRWRERAVDETDISGQHHLLNRDVDFGTSAITGFDFRVEISNRSIERNELRIIKLRNLDIETAMDGNHEIKEVH
jgi:hypothetical protein